MSSPARIPRIGRAGGFTLVEILVALVILSIMAALGYGTYRAARISGERAEESMQRSREIEFGMRVMESDFAEMVPRPVRDILGSTLLPALKGTGGIGTLTPLPASLSGSGSGSAAGSGMASSGMSFNSGSAFGSSASGVASIVDVTRAGWSNTAGQQRGTLQRVSYGLVDDVLKRSYMVHLDNVQGTNPVVQDLFTQVKALQLRYLDMNQVWQSQWPAPGVQAPDAYTQRPVAVEIIIEFKDWGRVRRLIEVAG